MTVEAPLPSMLVEDQQTLLQFTRTALSVEGDAAEAGVYNGGSAWLIWSIIKDSKKEFYLLDSFEGLAPEAEDYPLFGIQKKWYAGEEGLVRDLFLQYPAVHLMKGDCADLLKLLEGKTFSLVHLDLDLYRPTKLCLQFFLERIEVGGRVLVHDALTMTGVVKALKEVVRSNYQLIYNYALIERSELK